MLEKPSPHKTRLFFAAIEDQDPAVVREMLAAGFPVNTCDRDGCSPLAAAAAAGEPRTVEVLLAAGADIGQSGLARAASSNTRIVELLLDAGADINAASGFAGRSQSTAMDDERMLYPLTAACLRERRAVVEMLLDRGADPCVRTSSGATAAHCLLSSSLVVADPLRIRFVESTLETLLRRGVPADAADDNGNTLFSCLVKAQAPIRMFRLLFKHGADPRKADRRGLQPIHLAADRHRSDVVRLLTNLKIDIDTPASDGKTPLFFVGHGLGKFISQFQPDLNHQDADGNTVIHKWLEVHAIPEQTCSPVEDLLSAGASPNLRNLKGQSPMDIAKRRKLTACQTLLAAAAAREAMRNVQQEARSRNKVSKASPG